MTNEEKLKEAERFLGWLKKSPIKRILSIEIGQSKLYPHPAAPYNVPEHLEDKIYNTIYALVSANVDFLKDEVDPTRDAKRQKRLKAESRRILKTMELPPEILKAEESKSRRPHGGRRRSG